MLLRFLPHEKWRWMPFCASWRTYMHAFSYSNEISYVPFLTSRKIYVNLLFRVQFFMLWFIDWCDLFVVPRYFGWFLSTNEIQLSLGLYHRYRVVPRFFFVATFRLAFVFSLSFNLFAPSLRFMSLYSSFGVFLLDLVDSCSIFDF